LGIRSELSKIFRSSHDLPLQNLFRSRIIDMIFSELKVLVGYVQHDQYHRFTADQHILQALRETAAVKTSPRKLGKLSNVAKSLSQKEWDILFWTALFHDMAKGREGDHSELGAKFVEDRLNQLGFDRPFIEEIKWMVEHHLALSQAAFRENPLDVSTWHKLFDRDLNPERLRRLSVFTAIDVRATNPEAWTSWKEDLLHNLFFALSEGPAESVRALLNHVQKRKNSATYEVLVKDLDPFLVENFSPKTLLSDLDKILKGSDKESIAVHKDRSGKLWIRFFDRSDKKGLFLSYVSRLFLAGVSIDHASIHTLPDGGVYDWFCAGKSKTKSGGVSPQIIARRLMSFTRENASEKVSQTDVKFAEIELVREAPEGALISFRGRDQKGALLEASKGLLAANFEIVWARVHTWGRELDDQFFVKPRRDLHPALQDLRRKLLNH
jgi:[protein-PII] uridylyltransferase